MLPLPAVDLRSDQGFVPLPQVGAGGAGRGGAARALRRPAVLGGAAQHEVRAPPDGGGRRAAPPPAALRGRPGRHRLHGRLEADAGQSSD